MRAWPSNVPGIAEVFHARWREHAYPMHTHDTWTLLILDQGGISYGLDRHEHASLGGVVTLLPPHVPHDGRPADAAGFGKRVLYLDEHQLDTSLIGRSVDRPMLHDPALRQAVSRLDAAVVAGDTFAAEAGLALVAERITRNLTRASAPPPAADRVLARSLRERLDAGIATGVRLAPVAAELGVTVPHLVRSFTTAYGMPPHRYLVGRRVDAARHRLLAGEPAADVAVGTGFHDQPHLTRHFRRLLGTTPAAYQRSGRG